MPPCSKCRQPVEGAHLEALGRTWHTSCFRCAQCNEPFSEGAFVIHNKKPVHRHCYDRVRKPVPCKACRKDIVPGDMFVDTLEALWHVACFKCARCGRDFPDGKFFAEDGQPVHRVCNVPEVVGHVSADLADRLQL
eukprot:EG_transcript_23215